MNLRPTAQLLSGRERAARLAPFMSAFALGLALAWLPSGGPENSGLMIVAAALIVASAVTLLVGVWSVLPELATLVPVIALCVAVDLMRAASGGGSAAGYGSLLLIPVVWQAMRRRQLELFLTIAVVSIANVASIALLASPVALAAQWRSVILFTVVAATAGQTIHRLVADRTELLEQISALALIDPLTGLANRRTWDDRLPAMLATAARTQLPLTVALIDLDHFKAYNDTNGHQAGDQLLAEAATAWAHELRAGDLLVRWGGEEFALLLPATDSGEAEAALGRLQAAVPGGQTFSAGFVVERPFVPVQADADRIMAAADEALYRAKAAGRARSIQAPTADLDLSSTAVIASPTLDPVV